MVYGDIGLLRQGPVETGCDQTIIPQGYVGNTQTGWLWRSSWICYCNKRQKANQCLYFRASVEMKEEALLTSQAVSCTLIIRLVYSRPRHLSTREGMQLWGGGSMALCKVISPTLTICHEMLWQVSCHFYDSVQQDWERRSKVSKHMLLTLALSSTFPYWNVFRCCTHVPWPAFCRLLMSAWCRKRGPHASHHTRENSPLMRKWFTPQPSWLLSTALSHLKHI